VAPLGAVALLANVVFSPLILKERFHPSDLGGILLAIIGAVTVVFSSKQDDVTLNPDELWTAICRKEFIAYTIIAIGLAASLVWGSTTALGQRFVLLDVGVCAVLGGFTVLSTKGLSSLLSQGQLFELLEYPITYGLIIVLAGTALAQITFLNRALQRFDSREVIVSSQGGMQSHPLAY
jgi:drug/metabolite transporter (DMT)-like permease